MAALVEWLLLAVAVVGAFALALQPRLHCLLRWHVPHRHVDVRTSLRWECKHCHAMQPGRMALRRR